MQPKYTNGLLFRNVVACAVLVFGLVGCGSMPVSIPLLGKADEAKTSADAHDAKQQDQASNGNKSQKKDQNTGLKKAEVSQTQGDGLSLTNVLNAKVKPANQKLFERAIVLLQQGKVEPAEVLLQEITVSQPKLAGPWVNLGLIALAQKDVVHAQSMFERALKANPKSCDALNQMGILARSHGDFVGAESFYKRCLNHNPHRGDVQLNLGILYELYMGRLGDALLAYQAYQSQMMEPNQQVTGWVMDLERRVAALASR